MATIEFDTPEEVSEMEYLNQSLSVWKGKREYSDILYYCDDFEPVPLDLHTACSIGHVECVRQCIKLVSIFVPVFFVKCSLLWYSLYFILVLL